MSIAYPVKHWLISIILVPVLILLYVLMVSDFELAFPLGIFLVVTILALLISFPVFLIYLMAFKKLMNTNLSGWIIKLILNLVAIGGGGIIFLLFEDMGSMARDIFIAYTAAITITSFIFKLRPRESS